MILFSIFLVFASLMLTSCEVGISPLEYDPSTSTVQTTGTLDDNGDIGQINIVLPENAGELDVDIELYGAGSEYFTITLDKNAYGYQGAVIPRPDNPPFYQDTTFTFFARTVVNGQKLCAKKIQKTIYRTEVPPVVKNLTLTLKENTNISVTFDATDLNKDKLTFHIVIPPKHGSIQSVDGVHFIYTPTIDYDGVDSFAYFANDGRSDSNTAVVNIDIVNVGDVELSDITPPVITLNGINPTTVNLLEKYIDAGATAIDNRDGKVDVFVSGSVNTHIAGSYTITYTATDRAGNTTTLTRVVHVLERYNPTSHYTQW